MMGMICVEILPFVRSMKRCLDAYRGARYRLAVFVRNSAEVAKWRFACGHNYERQINLMSMSPDRIRDAVHPALPDLRFDPVKRILARVVFPFECEIKHVRINLVKSEAALRVRCCRSLEDF